MDLHRVAVSRSTRKRLLSPTTSDVRTEREQALELVDHLREVEIRRRRVLLHVPTVSAADDRGADAGLREDPSDRELGHGRIQSIADGAQKLHDGGAAGTPHRIEEVAVRSVSFHAAVQTARTCSIVFPLKTPLASGSKIVTPIPSSPHRAIEAQSSR
jgi:hypothetical protein